MPLSTQNQIEKFGEFLETYHEKDMHNVLIRPDSDGIIHNSRSGMWKFAMKLIRNVPNGAKIYQSVIDRMSEPMHLYDPVNLPKEGSRTVVDQNW